MPPKHQSFCFTHNNYGANDIIRLQNLDWYKYMIFGKEIAPSTGTPHLQGYLWTLEPRTLQQIKRKMPGSAVFAPGKDKGPEYWRTYCSKEDVDMFESGISPSEAEHQDQCPKGAGARTDLMNLKQAIDDGGNCDSLIDHVDHFNTFVHHKKFFFEYQSHKRRRTAYSIPEVHVRYGPTATNKSRYAWDNTPFDEMFKWDPGMEKWFDGYVGQHTVLFDEFRGQLPFGQLLTLLDGYPTKVQTKGGTAHWSPKIIYMTSPRHPKDWYPNSPDDSVDQLLRRCTTITCTANASAPTSDQASCSSDP